MFILTFIHAFYATYTKLSSNLTILIHRLFDMAMQLRSPKFLIVKLKILIQHGLDLVDSRN